MLLSGDLLRQSGRCDVHQPVEDSVARDTGDPAVSIEVRLGDFIGMELQHQVGTANIPGGITAAGIGPIDHDGLRRLAQNVHRMEIAVAQAIAIRHVLEAIEQDLLPRLVERHGSDDARCQPTLQAAELVRRQVSVLAALGDPAAFATITSKRPKRRSAASITPGQFSSMLTS